MQMEQLSGAGLCRNSTRRTPAPSTPAVRMPPNRPTAPEPARRQADKHRAGLPCGLETCISQVCIDGFAQERARRHRARRPCKSAECALPICVAPSRSATESTPSIRVRHRHRPSRRTAPRYWSFRPVRGIRKSRVIRVLRRVHGVAVELPVVVRLDRLRPDLDRGTADVSRPRSPARSSGVRPRSRRPTTECESSTTSSPRKHPTRCGSPATPAAARSPGRSRRTDRTCRRIAIDPVDRCPAATHRVGRRRRAGHVHREDARDRRRHRGEVRTRRGQPSTLRSRSASGGDSHRDRLDGSRRHARRPTCAGRATDVRRQRRPPTRTRHGCRPGAHVHRAGLIHRPCRTATQCPTPHDDSGGIDLRCPRRRDQCRVWALTQAR